MYKFFFLFCCYFMLAVFLFSSWSLVFGAIRRNQIFTILKKNSIHSFFVLFKSFLCFLFYQMNFLSHISFHISPIYIYFALFITISLFLPDSYKMHHFLRFFNFVDFRSFFSFLPFHSFKYHVISSSFFLSGTIQK